MTILNIPNRRIALLLLAAMPIAAATADVVQLEPSKDNTLYQDSGGKLSNGKGNYIFAGVSGGPKLRHAVLAFDIATNVPAGSTITSAQLTLTMDRTSNGAYDFELRRLARDWGEGSSKAEGSEGSGAPAQPGDATWIHTFYDTAKWDAIGGDYATDSSATISIDQIGIYTWGSTDAMVADVQSWLDDPSTSFGWLIRDTQVIDSSAKRFASRDNADSTIRPVLELEFTPPDPCQGALLGDSNCDGTVDFNDIDCFVAALISEEQWLNCGGSGGCDFTCVNDVDDNDAVNFEDIDGFVTCLINGC